MNAPALDALLNLDEAAAWLRMHPKALVAKTLGSKPLVPCIRLGRKTLRFHPRTILATMAAHGGVPMGVISASLFVPHSERQPQHLRD